MSYKKKRLSFEEYAESRDRSDHIRQLIGNSPYNQTQVAACAGIASSTLTNWLWVGLTVEQADRIESALSTMLADRIKRQRAQ